MAALPELEKQGYRFVVVNDPERKGYLVYEVRLMLAGLTLDTDTPGANPGHERLLCTSPLVPVPPMGDL